MNHGNNFIKTVTYPPRVIIYHHRHAHAPQNARDFRHDFDVDNLEAQYCQGIGRENYREQKEALVEEYRQKIVSLSITNQVLT